MLSRVLATAVLLAFPIACAPPAVKCPPSGAQESPAAAPPPVRDPANIQLERYSLVILRRGPAWTPEQTPATQALQKQHLGHLLAMAKAGKMVVAGPFDDQKDETMLGMCLYKTPLDEARSLAEGDPAVKAGRLTVEVLTWYTEKGALAFPMAAEMAKAK